jgi:hypothetical protein
MTAITSNNFSILVVVTATIRTTAIRIAPTRPAMTARDHDPPSEVGHVLPIAIPPRTVVTRVTSSAPINLFQRYHQGRDNMRRQGKGKRKRSTIAIVVAAPAAVTTLAIMIAMRAKAHVLSSDVSYIPSIAIPRQGVAASVALSGPIMPREVLHIPPRATKDTHPTREQSI